MSTLMKNDKTIAGLVGGINNLASPISLNDYSASSPFIVPSDGYVSCSANTSSSPVDVTITGADGSNVFRISTAVSAQGNTLINTCYVKKGMKIYKTSTTGYAEFRALT